MDGDRFDGLARLAARRLGRRAALAGALAALVGGGAAANGGGRAKRAKPGWPCQGDADCGAGHRCVRPTGDALVGSCKPGDGACAGLSEFCGPGRSCCGDLQCRMTRGGERVCLPPAKPLGARCREAAECQGGRCARGRCGCHPKLVRCGAECVDRRTDPRHCGGCGKACSADQRCADGQCVAGGGGGWGWGGNACSFPTDDGFCWGWPYLSYTTKRVKFSARADTTGLFHCAIEIDDYDCPLCAPWGKKEKCDPMDDPTREQAERFCRKVEHTYKRVSCRAEDCPSGEFLCREKSGENLLICTASPHMCM